MYRIVTDRTLRYIILHYATLYYTTLYDATLFALCRLFCTTLYDSILRPTLLHYATLSYTEPHYSTHKRPSNDEPYLSTYARIAPGSTDTTPFKYHATCRRVNDAAPYLPPTFHASTILFASPAPRETVLRVASTVLQHNTVPSSICETRSRFRF